MYSTFIKPLYQDIKKFALDTLFPIQCIICGKDNEFVCPDCKTKLAILDHQYCIVCQKPSLAGLTHPLCQTPHGPDGLVSVFDYHNENVKNIIIKGKYSFVAEFYKILGLMVADTIKSQYADLFDENSILVPIPLSPFRKRWRGFNQAQVLCETLSGQLDFPVANALKRHKLTKVQKDIKKRNLRAKNMEGAFKLHTDIFLLFKEGYPDGNRGGAAEANKNPIDVHGLNFILVDDVVTTGSTLLEAVKVLKRNGANKVYCLTIAKD